MVVWIIILAALAAVALIELRWLNRQRRLFLSDPQRRRFFVHYMQRTVHEPRRAPAQERPGAPRFPSVPRPRHQAKPTGSNGTAVVPRPKNGDDGVAYIDAEGRCTFANETARDLLHWRKGELALSDVLAGGSEECAALLAALARQGALEPHATALAGSPPTPVEISAVALRDRDDNFWGAAFFIRLAVATTAPAEPSHH